MANNSILASLAVLIKANTSQFNTSLSQSQAALKSFQSTVSTVGATLGVSLGASTVFQGLKYGISVISEFEASMSEVKAITGATGPEFQKLTKNALDLGAATKFTAKEVSQLQVAYGRLGFTTKEILNATKATLDLAAATGEDLAKSADIAGSTVRAFGLDASETLRVADVMASSFNKSALGLDNFGEAMKYVAPVAANANISLEQTTALLGVLADNGIRGSMAGTSLRKIISDLGQGAGPILNKRLKELAISGASGAQAMDEVGRTAYASLLILAKNTDKVDAAAKAYENATGEVAKMAAVMQDNLAGDVTKATSALDGFILTGSGVTSVLREATQETTAFIRAAKEAQSLPGIFGAILTGGPASLKILKEAQIEIDKVNQKRDELQAGRDKKNSFIPTFEVDPLSGLPLNGEGGKATSEFDKLASGARTVDFLKAAIKALEDSIGGMSDRGAILKVRAQADALNEELQKLIGTTVKLKEYATKDFSVSDDFNKLGEELKKIAEIRKYGDIKLPDFSEFSKNFKLPDAEPFKFFADEIKEVTVELAPILTEFAGTLGEFFADLNNGVGEMIPFGERLKSLVGGIMQSVGGALIAIGIGKIAIKLPGPQAIAAGVALVAAGAALSKSAANAKKAINGGSGGSSSDSVERAADNQRQNNITINNGDPFIFRIQGRDLVAVSDKYNYNKGRGGG